MPTIFMLHRVLPKYDPENYYFQRKTAISWSRFTRLLDKIDDEGYETLPASALEKASSNSVFITFDDGYSDNISAIDELQKRGMTATIFPVKSFCEEQFSPVDDMAAHLVAHKDLAPNVRESAISGRIKKIIRRLSFSRYRFLRKKLFGLAEDAMDEGLFLTPNQLTELSNAGIELGIHGCSHRVFTALPKRALKEELDESLNWIKSLGSSGETAICFPHGSHNTQTLETCKAYAKVLLGVDSPPVCSKVYRRIHVTEDL